MNKLVANNSSFLPSVEAVIAADYLIDKMGFVDDQAAILARVPGEGADVARLFPDAEEFTAYGVSTVALAALFGAGLTPRQLAKASEIGLALIDQGLDFVSLVRAVAAGLNARAFSQAVKNGMSVAEFAGMAERYDMSTLNWAIEEFNAFKRETQRRPNLASRVLYRLEGACCC